MSLARKCYAICKAQRKRILFLAAATSAVYYVHTNPHVKNRILFPVTNRALLALPGTDSVFIFHLFQKGVCHALCDALLTMHNDSHPERQKYLSALNTLLRTYANSDQTHAELSLFKLGTLINSTLNEETREMYSELSQTLTLLMEKDKSHFERQNFYTLQSFPQSKDALKGFLKLSNLETQSREFCVYAISRILEQSDHISTEDSDCLLLSKDFISLLHGEEEEIERIFQCVFSICRQRNISEPDPFLAIWLKRLNESSLKLESLASWRMLLACPEMPHRLHTFAIDMQNLLRLAREIHCMDECEQSELVIAKRRLAKIVYDIIDAAERLEDICLFHGSSKSARVKTFFSSVRAPMDAVFRTAIDVADLPVYGAEEYDACTELGWMDLIASWSISEDVRVAGNAIASLERLGWLALRNNEESGVNAKQLLQAWLMQLLQSIRGLYCGEEVLAIKAVEDIAAMSKEDTPGSEKIVYNPLVIRSGVHALAVFAEKYDKELVRRGVLPLLSLLAASQYPQEPEIRAECARVIANLLASVCSLMSESSQQITLDIRQEMERFESGKWFFRELLDWKSQSQIRRRSNYYRAMENLKAFDELRLYGHTNRPVYHESVNIIPPISSSCDSGNCEPLDIVLIHGLRGDPFGTWRRNCIAKRDQFWPEKYLLSDLQRHGIEARILTMGYEAGMVTWSSPWPSLSLEERARVMLNALYKAKVGIAHGNERPTPVIFLTHSLGGLLLKEMLLVASEHRNGLHENTAGIVFLAVPHFGSDLAKGVHYDAIRSLMQAHPAIRDICANKGRLEALNESFRKLHIHCLNLAEAKPSPLGIGLSAMIVKPKFADPKIGTFQIIPGADHMTICKATSKKDPMYALILQYILENDFAKQRKLDVTEV